VSRARLASETLGVLEVGAQILDMASKLSRAGLKRMDRFLSGLQAESLGQVGQERGDVTRQAESARPHGERV
jgi:hypothetical protein